MPFNMVLMVYSPPDYLLCEAKDGLLLVVGVGAEALDVHSTAEPL